MNARMNSLLESMHTKLRRQESGPRPAPLRRAAESRTRRPAPRRRVREEDETAWGPTSGQEWDDKSHLASKAGVGGATNVPDRNDVFDKFMSACMDALMNGMGWEEGQANSFINKVAGEMESEGFLPPMPGEGAENEAEELAVWLAGAQTVGFIAELLQRARAAQ